MREAIMSLFYRFAYAVGFTPWDRTGELGAVGREVLALVAGEEHGEPPYGRALDLGSGRGRFSVALAGRGWEVTGVDAVPRAVRFARTNAARAGAAVRFVSGDVTALPPEVGDGYRLLLDLGCLHGMSDRDRARAVGEQARVSAPGAALVLFAFAPHPGPGPRGILPERVEQLYAGWRLEEHAALRAPVAGGRASRWEPHLYRLRRPSQPGPGPDDGGGEGNR